jgi:small-conductance mechanosensitive channel
MDTQQALNLAIVDAFAAEKIEFAYPTRTLYLERTQSQK